MFSSPFIGEDKIHVMADGFFPQRAQSLRCV